eukprot:TRINITY_DN36270_c0_g1_i1.p1 TRINITY_DN36270_c0_g1~~TRINITY_DN36270_c0_g1_i1.p1  ORF type:complete len:636 (+),score=164.66 TRINITY_DN36270_c0_g1_i1:61-1968(+)
MPAVSMLCRFLALVGPVLVAMLAFLGADMYYEWQAFAKDPRSAFSDEEHGSLTVMAELAAYLQSRPSMCPGRHESELCDDKVLNAKVATLDRHTRFLFNLFKTRFQADDPSDPANVPEASAVMKQPREKYSAGMPTIDIGLGYVPEGQDYWSLRIPSMDDEDEGDWFGSQQEKRTSWILGLLAHPSRHPIVDANEKWDSEEQADSALRTAIGGDLRQRMLGVSTDHTSDEAISRWAFAGLAAHRLECPGVTGRKADLVQGFVKVEGTVPADEHCQVAFSWMGIFSVRPGFERYGATAFFSKDRKLTKIWWDFGAKMVKPGDADWAHAKWVWKCSVLTGVTFRDHLTGVHLMAGNLLTVASREGLAADHPIRRLVKPFTYGTIGINVAASNTLTCNHSLVHRAIALPFEEIQKGWDVILRHERQYKQAPEHLKLMGTDKLGGEYPFGQDWVAFDAVVQKFVDGYVSIYYGGSGQEADDKVLADADVAEFWSKLRAMPGSKVVPLGGDGVRPRDQLVSLLTNLLVFVTGIHNHVGNVGDYLLRPSYSSGKIRPGTEVSDVQSSFQAVNIALTTAVPQPGLLSNVDHLLLDERAKKVWATFRADLETLADEIDARNVKRGSFVCNSFNPRRVLISVSV